MVGPQVSHETVHPTTFTKVVVVCAIPVVQNSDRPAQSGLLDRRHRTSPHKFGTGGWACGFVRYRRNNHIGGYCCRRSTWEAAIYTPGRARHGPSEVVYTTISLEVLGPGPYTPPAAPQPAGGAYGAVKIIGNRRAHHLACPRASTTWCIDGHIP